MAVLGSGTISFRSGPPTGRRGNPDHITILSRQLLESVACECYLRVVHQCGRRDPRQFSVSAGDSRVH